MMIGVSQIDRVVEVVEETLKGNKVRLFGKKALPKLDLPKVRRNKHVEIVPLSTGCLGRYYLPLCLTLVLTLEMCLSLSWACRCTYCKTKHARGELGSYDKDALVQRIKSVVEDPQV